MALYLLRHTSVSMPKGICYGNTDVGLADSFEQELEAVKKQLEGVAFSKVYSSPLTRCTRLAEAFSENVIIDKRITEYSFGKWERVTQIPHLGLVKWVKSIFLPDFAIGGHFF